MNCPYCSKEMAKGFINGSNNVRWYPEGAAIDELWPENEGTVLLAKTGWVTSARAEAYYCGDCGMVIVPVVPCENTTDKLKQKWSALAERIGEESEKRREEKQAAKRQKAKEKMRKKDPWEV